jgi:hypothetical protein
VETPQTHQTVTDDSSSSLPENLNLLNILAALVSSGLRLLGTPVLLIVKSAVISLLWLLRCNYRIELYLWLPEWHWQSSASKQLKKAYKWFIRQIRRIFEYRLIRPRLGHMLILIGILIGVISPATAFSNFSDEQVPVSMEISTTLSESLALHTQHSVQLPVNKMHISQQFSAGHPGWDIDGDLGDEIKAVMPGQVESVLRHRYSYGNHILVNHGGAVQTLYAHLAKIFVNTGDKVSMDTILGEMGSTGNSTGDHLHLEVIDQDKRVNPGVVLWEEMKEEREER